MDHQTAREYLKHLQEWLERGASQPAAADAGAVPEDCGCRSKSREGADRGGAGVSSIIQVFKQLANAFRPALTGDPAAQWSQVGSALILSAAAVNRFAADLRTLGPDEGGGREKFAEALASPLEDAGTVLHSVGGRCLGEEQKAPVAAEGWLATSQSFHAVSNLLVGFPEGRDGGPFQVYGESWFRIGLALGDFLRALTDQPPGSNIAPDVAACYENCQRTMSAANALIAQCFFFGLGNSVPRPPNTCPPSCPRQGCTRYCHDEYSNPTACGPWVRVGSGVFTSGGWSITCTWTIDSVIKDVCCCYPGYWKKFWAYGDCGCQTTLTVTGTRTAKYTYVSPTRTAPPAPPASFTIETC